MLINISYFKNRGCLRCRISDVDAKRNLRNYKWLRSKTRHCRIWNSKKYYKIFKIYFYIILFIKTKDKTKA